MRAEDEPRVLVRSRFYAVGCMFSDEIACQTHEVPEEGRGDKFARQASGSQAAVGRVGIIVRHKPETSLHAGRHRTREIASAKLDGKPFRNSLP